MEHPPVSEESSPQVVNVICVKWGTRYGVEYVNRLYRGVQRHLRRPHRFYCFTEFPEGLDEGIVVKDLEMLVVAEHLRNDIFQKTAIMHSLTGLQGPTLFLDLDVVILGSLDDFFTFEPDRFCVIHNWIERRKRIFRRAPDIGNTSVFRFVPGTCDHILERFLADPDHARNDFPTEQAFVTDCMRPLRTWWPDAWVRSFKRHAHWTLPLNFFFKPRVDAQARILVFHGLPDPDQAIAGFRGKLHYRTRPWPELAEHWS